MGQETLNSTIGLSFAAVAIIGGARALGRYHRRAERMLWRAECSKSGTFERLVDALQDQAADAVAAFLSSVICQPEAAFGVKEGVTRTQPQSALGDLADAAPLARDDLEHIA